MIIGSNAFPGINSRMEKELRFLKNKYIDVKEFSFLGNYLSFCGASITANSYIKEDRYWISKKDWDEYGSNIILKKCNTILN